VGKFADATLFSIFLNVLKRAQFSIYRVVGPGNLGTCQPNDERVFLDEIESLDYAALRTHPWVADLALVLAAV
jgi:hypothetical protein